MSQDHLQIGLEHHRNGRLTQAEASYRALLKQQAGHPEAMHWLGVLHSQAGQWKEAIEWLSQAAAVKPGDAAYQHNLGQAYLNAGEFDHAVQAFEAASANAGEHAETRFSLGLALMARRQPDDPAEAVIAFSQAIGLGMDSPEAHRHLGAALLAAGQSEEAMVSLKTALSKKSEDAPTRYLLAMVEQDLGDVAEVRKNLLKAVEIDETFGRAWRALAELEAQDEHWGQAAALYRRAIAVKADDAAAYQGLGRVLQNAGKTEEALTAMRQAVRASRAVDSQPKSIEHFEQKIKLTSINAELHYTLATVTNLTPPAQIPAALLTDLFDRYAETFDDHLRKELLYTLPEKIVDAVAAQLPAVPMDILDLGCGTGLCGPLLKPWARWLAGVDLSPLMIERAKLRDVYDRLEVCDLVDALRRADRAFDLLTAADVLLYIGDLSPVFEAAAKALRPGGLFAYSVEGGTGDRYYLQVKSKRFAHSEPYLKKLAAMYGFKEESFEAVAARMDGGKPVPAYLAVLRSQG